MYGALQFSPDLPSPFTDPNLYPCITFLTLQDQFVLSQYSWVCGPAPVKGMQSVEGCLALPFECMYPGLSTYTCQRQKRVGGRTFRLCYFLVKNP